MKKDCVMSVRVDKNTKDLIKEYDVSLKEIIDFYIVNNTDIEKKEMNELKSLLEENNHLTNQMIKNNNRIDEIKDKYNIKEDNQAVYTRLSNKEIIKSVNRCLDYYSKYNKNGIISFEDFVEHKKDYINNQAVLCGKDNEEFNMILLNHYYKTKQTTL